MLTNGATHAHSSQARVFARNYCRVRMVRSGGEMAFSSTCSGPSGLEIRLDLPQPFRLHFVVLHVVADTRETESSPFGTGTVGDGNRLAARFRYRRRSS